LPEEYAIAGNRPGGEQYHVTGHYYLGGSTWPYLQHICLDLDPRQQFFHRSCGVVFLHKAQNGGPDNDHEHHGGVNPLANQHGNADGKNQDKNQRVPELSEKQAKGGILLFSLERIQTNGLQAATRLIGVQAFGPGIKLVKQIGIA
jgi:hypothetical protein